MAKSDDWKIWFALAAGVLGIGYYIYTAKPTCETCGKTEEEKAKEPPCGCNAGK